MSEFAQSLSFSTLLLLAAFIIQQIISRQFSSFSLVLLGLVLIEPLHLALEYILLGSGYGFSDYPKLYLFWYVGFALTDLLFVYSVILLTRNLRLKRMWESDLILLLYAVLAIFQLVRYVDRAYANNYWSEALYSIGVPLINVSVVLIVILTVAKSIWIETSTGGQRS